MLTPPAPIDAAIDQRQGLSDARGARRLAAALLLCSLFLSPTSMAQPRGTSPTPSTGSQDREARVERIVIEDSGSRIEELRVRSQTRSIHVQTKGALAGGYEVVPADPARDSAPGPSSGGGQFGQARCGRCSPSERPPC